MDLKTTLLNFAFILFIIIVVSGVWLIWASSIIVGKVLLTAIFLFITTAFVYRQIYT